MIISVLNQKGGSGKTTIATNLARAYQLSGKKVLLVDSDTQGSARRWNMANEGKVLPVIGLDRPTLPADLKAIQTGYEMVIIDGAPNVARMSSVAAQVSNVILIPVTPSPYDVWACKSLVDIVKQRMDIDPSLKAAFVISRAIVNARVTGDVIEALEHFELPVLEGKTHQRLAYSSTVMEGLTVVDLRDGNLAKQEVLNIQKDVDLLMA